MILWQRIAGKKIFHAYDTPLHMDGRELASLCKRASSRAHGAFHSKPEKKDLCLHCDRAEKKTAKASGGLDFG